MSTFEEKLANVKLNLAAQQSYALEHLNDAMMTLLDIGKLEGEVSDELLEQINQMRAAIKALDRSL